MWGTGGMASIEDRLTRALNRPSGFDYMRLVLASGVIAQHTVNVSYGHLAAVALFHTPARIPFGIILPMFFSLSGFLVAGSLERNRSLISFLGLRAIRLLPALAFEVGLSAVFLGVIFTTMAPRDYFLDQEFRSYFLNIIGWIHYQLPGVFVGNPVPRIVNGQLWTIPAELKCYITLAALGFVGVIGRKRYVGWVIGITQLALMLLAIKNSSMDPAVVPIPVLVGCFLIGVCAFRIRDAIHMTLPTASIAGIVTAILLVSPHGDWLLPVPVSYLTIYVGTLNPKRDKFLLSGDYSYGLYLYGFPIQQAVATQSWAHDWWINFVIAYPVALFFAILSWWLVEKPAMKLKALIYRAEDFGLGFRVVEWHSRRVFSPDSDPRVRRSTNSTECSKS